MHHLVEPTAALEWYVYLAQQPAWKAQAWHSVNWLAQLHPMYADLPAQLVAAMKEKNENSDRAGD